MEFVTTGAGAIHVAVQGPPDGPPVMFSNSLGTDFRIWDGVIARMDPGLRIIRYDKRGHGLSDCPPRLGADFNWGMADHVADAAKVLEAYEVRDAVVVGLSVGGMIAQGLAAERPDLVRAMVLSNTGAKIGSPDMWDQRISAIEADGLAAQADGVMERWFSRKFRAEDPQLALWRNMLVRTPLDGYLGTCAAIRDTDLMDSTARLRLPTMGIVGDEDGATPPDMVRETTELVPGSAFHVIAGAGHLPCVEQPDHTARLINGFLKGIGHV